MSALAIGLCLAASPLTACTGDTDRFCDEFRGLSDLTDLSQAIRTRDERKIVANLEALRKVQDVAPEAIFDDFRKLIDALSGVIRIVTKAPDETGTTSQVDATELTQQLQEFVTPSHNVTEYADRNCGISLDP